MIYANGDDWLKAKQKRVMLFGMSGLGKTHISDILRQSGNWFHYSVDYRIGTRYMGEHIVDNFKKQAMQNPFLRELLMSDSIYIGSNITFNNLSPLSTYLGKPGDVEKGGIPFAEYMRRQGQHMAAETAAMQDTPHFVDRAREVYGYDNFVCDSSGSICEIVEPDDPEDEVLKTLSETLQLIWIEGSGDHTEELIRRFDRAPKPMCYQAAFIEDAWAQYLRETNVPEEKVDPNAFIRWTYARALAHRQPRYAAIAKNWGMKVSAEDVARVRSAADFDALVANALG